MPQDTENATEMTTQDLQLQKLGDIESILTMRIEQGHDSKDDAELMHQLLAKVVQGIGEMKSMRLSLEGVETVTLKGEKGEDADPADVAKILLESENFIARLKGDKGDKGDSVKGDKGDRGDDGETPKVGEDFLTPEEMEGIKTEITDDVESRLPEKIKEEVLRQIKPEQIVAKVNELVGKRKITTGDVEGLAEMFRVEIERVYDSVRMYSSKKGGGGSLNLRSLYDIDFSQLKNGGVLAYNPTLQQFYFTDSSLQDTSIINAIIFG